MQAKNAQKDLIFTQSKSGRQAIVVPKLDVPEHNEKEYIPVEYIRSKAPALPEVSELELMRHFVNLSQLNFCIDKGFYPLGSCTMKYNPKVNDLLAALEGFRELHPLQPTSQIQGALELMWKLQERIAAIV